MLCSPFDPTTAKRKVPLDSCQRVVVRWAIFSWFFLWSCTQLFPKRYILHFVPLGLWPFRSSVSRPSTVSWVFTWNIKDVLKTMFRLRSAKSASLQVILAHVCTTNHTKMYNNWSYIISIHTANRNLRVKSQIPRSLKPMRWNHPIDIGHNRSKQLTPTLSSFYIFAAKSSTICSLTWD